MEDIKQLTNASQMPKIYYCRHMKEGVARYMDEDLYVGMEAITKMCKTFTDPACPVYVHHQDVDMKNIQNADGYVVDSFYNELDGWFWVKIVVTSDKAHEAIANGWAVSNAYEPKEMIGGGTCLNVPFDREVLDGDFTHLAIVPNPRYEEACIMTPSDFKAHNEKKREQLNELRNSKDEHKESSTTMLKLFKREKVELENSAEILEASVELENGKEISIAEMKQFVENAMEEEKAKAEEEKANTVDMETKLNVGDEEMTIEELVNKYMNMCTKKNSESEDEESEDEEKENAEEEAKKAEEEKANAIEAEIVNSIKTAISKGQTPSLEEVDTECDAIKRGKERY